MTCAALVLVMTSWFSATAVLPALAAHWGLTAGDAAWLTIWVQIGFVAGALFASISGLPDIVSLRLVMGLSALLAALSNIALLWAPDAGFAYAARFVTGFALAGVYPPAMKLISTWFVHGRGTALGVVVGALTLGSASPHLIRALAVGPDWQAVIIASTICVTVGAFTMGVLVREGPFPFARASFDPAKLGAVLRDRPLLLANIGYFGHMWELYAMWGWFLAFAAAALPALGLADAASASLLAFAVIASGLAGAVAGGLLADRIGRTATAAIMLALSGLCALTIGFAFDGPLWLLVAIGVLWGVTVIGDSAQFSAMATELADRSQVGAALALQLGLGFALTVVSIRLTPVVADWIGWRWTFLILVPGPVVGLIAMMLLRRHPGAVRIAHGLR